MDLMKQQEIWGQEGGGQVAEGMQNTGSAGRLPGPVAHCKASTGQLTATAVPTSENQGRGTKQGGASTQEGHLP